MSNGRIGQMAMHSSNATHSLIKYAARLLKGQVRNEESMAM